MDAMYSSSSYPASPSASSVAMPGYLSADPSAGLKSYLPQMQSMYANAIGNMTTAGNNAINSNFDQGTALAAAGARAYMARAQQSGGSQLGAGFAQGQAMLPVYGQKYNALNQMAQNQLSATGQEAGLGANINEAIGNLTQQRASLMAQYTGQQQQLRQQQQQYYSGLGFQQQQLAQQGSQFSQNLGFQQQELAQKGQLGTQSNQLMAAALAAKLYGTGSQNLRNQVGNLAGANLGTQPGSTFGPYSANGSSFSMPGTTSISYPGSQGNMNLGQMMGQTDSQFNQFFGT